VKAVVFDFDGLILDTEGALIESWSRIFSEHGAPFEPELLHPLIGTTDIRFDVLSELERRLGHPVNREQLRRRQRGYVWAHIDTLTPLPGVLERLAEAEELGLRIGLATSSSYAWAEGHLHRLGLLPRFHALACRDDVARTKPDPALYLLATERLGIDPGEALAFEDSAHGITAARAAGLHVVAVPHQHTAHMDLSHASQRIVGLDRVTLRELRCSLTWPTPKESTLSTTSRG